jgi:hypothetical protein
MLETMVTGMAGAGTGIATVAVGAGILMAVGAPLTVPLLGVTVVATGAAVGAIYVAKKAYEKLKKRLYVGGNSAASSSVTQGENKSKVSVNSAPSGSSTVVSSGVPHNALSSSGYTPLFSQSETMGNVQMSSQNDEQGSGRPSNQFLTSQLSSQGDQHSNVTPPSSRQQRRQPFSMPPSSSLVSSNQQPYNQLESNPMHSQSDQYSNVLPLSSSQFRSSTTQPSSQSRSIPLGSSTTLLYQRPSLGENDTGNSYVFGNFDD